MATESGDREYDEDDLEGLVVVPSQSLASNSASESLTNNSALRYLLMKACRLGHVNAVEKLLSVGVKVAVYRNSDEVLEGKSH